jgi:hypothetical protein
MWNDVAGRPEHSHPQGQRFKIASRYTSAARSALGASVPVRTARIAVGAVLVVALLGAAAPFDPGVEVPTPTSCGRGRTLASAGARERRIRGAGQGWHAGPLTAKLAGHPTAALAGGMP